MLFSNPKVADYINEWFEPVWQSLRPVPTVTIDFHNGHVVKRTLQGNIATLICSPDGEVLDVLPGIYTAAGYLMQLEKLTGLSAIMRSEKARRKQLLAEFYGLRDPEARENWPTRPSHSGWSFNKASANRRGAFGADQPSDLNQAFTPAGNSGGSSLLGRLVKARYANGPEHGTPSGPATRLMGKSSVEAPLKAAVDPGFVPPHYEPKTPPKGLRNLSAEEASKWDALLHDTIINERLRREMIHKKLMESDTHLAGDILKWLYREVLDSDLDDPYLGLGKQLFGGYPFEK